MININQKTKRYRKLETGKVTRIDYVKLFTRKFEYNLKFEIDEKNNTVKCI